MDWSRVFSGILFIGMLSFISGCMSFSTLQTAETLPPGQLQIGAGAIVAKGGTDWGAIPEVSGRVGVVNDLDVGLKYSLLDVIMLDGKYRFLNSGIEGAFDFAWSTNTGDDPERVNGYYPMLIFGQKHWYAGVKAIYLTTTGSINLWGSDISLNSSGYSATDFIVGGVVGGGALRALIELNTFVNNDGEVIMFPAVGISLTP
jgi:hypothetical protein